MHSLARTMHASIMDKHRAAPWDYRRTCSSSLVDSIVRDKVLSTSEASEGSGLSEADPMRCASCLQYDASGTKLAAATSDCSVLIYDAQRGNCEHDLKSHSEIITSLAWLEMPSRAPAFYTSSLDKTIRLWVNYKPVDVYTDHADWIRCLGISKDSQTLLSGCVSSNVVGWDTGTGKIKFKLGVEAAQKSAVGAKRKHGAYFLTFEHSVNSLAFTQNHNVFACGVRHGVVQLWDARALKDGAVGSINGAHSGKLNQVQVSQCDSMILSSGRDSAARVWDVRMLGGDDSSECRKRSLRHEFKAHRCVSYNTSSIFWGNDRYIATGSEDKKIWIYDIKAEKAVRTLEGHSSVVHFLAAPPNDYGLQLASTSINCNDVFVWSPDCSGGRGEISRKSSAQSYDRISSMSSAATVFTNADMELSDASMEDAEDFSSGPFGASSGNAQEVGGPVAATEQSDPESARRTAIETLMHRHGDFILRIFHMYDYSFRAPFDWYTLLRHVHHLQGGRSDDVPIEGSGEGGSAEGSVEAREWQMYQMAQDFLSAVDEGESSLGNMARSEH